MGTIFLARSDLSNFFEALADPRVEGSSPSCATISFRNCGIATVAAGAVCSLLHGVWLRVF